MKTYIITICTILAGIACTDDDNTRKTLQMHGFTNVQTTGYSPSPVETMTVSQRGFGRPIPAGNQWRERFAVGCLSKAAPFDFEKDNPL